MSPPRSGRSPEAPKGFIDSSIRKDNAPERIEIVHRLWIIAVAPGQDEGVNPSLTRMLRLPFSVKWSRFFSVLPITLGEQSFKFGPIEVPYSSVSGAGVSARNIGSQSHRTLLIAYTMPGVAKTRLITFGLFPGAPGSEFVEKFRVRSGIGDRWRFEQNHAALKKALGVPSFPVALFIVAIVIVTVAVVIGAAILQKRSPEAPRPVDTSLRRPVR